MTIDKLSVSNQALTLIGGARLTTYGETTTEEGRVISAVYDDVRDMVLGEHPWGFAQKRAVLVDMTKPVIDIWVTETAYAVDDVVEYDSEHYTCLIAHTSDVFTVDLTAVKWELTTDWVTATTYSPGDQVYYNGVSYSCVTLHTSGVWATDLAAVKWIASEYPAMDEDNMTKVYKLPSDFVHLSYTSDENAKVKVEGARVLSDTGSLKIAYTYQNDTPSLYTAMFRIALSVRLAAEICFNLTNMATKAADLMEKYETIDLPKAMATDSNQETPRSVRQDEWENAKRAGAGIIGKTGDATWHPEG